MNLFKTALSIACLLVISLQTLSAPGDKFDVVTPFNDVTVNPKDDAEYRIVSTVYFVTSTGMSEVESLVARESIAFALKQFSTSQIQSAGSINSVKNKIVEVVKDAELIGGDRVEKVFVTDLVVLSAIET